MNTNFLTARGRVTGQINGVRLDAEVTQEITLSTGTILTRLQINSKPRSFAVIASSGVSWGCWSNSGGSVSVAGASNIFTLSGGNYELKRRNEFPDGSGIAMHFKVKREGDDKLEMNAEWNGTYGLPTDIVGLRAPIIEELKPGSDGVVESHYNYTVVAATGEEFVVNTPSTYSFAPTDAGAKTVPMPQRRVMTFAVSEVQKDREYLILTQSIMTPSDQVPAALSSSKGLIMAISKAY